MNGNIRLLLMFMRDFCMRVLSVLCSRLARVWSAVIPAGNSGDRLTHVSFYSRAFRVITWVNIICQLGFPLALAFTPSVLAAAQ
ncbi:hypothetical protein BCN13_27920, partial [Salmonella enterica]|nr:hypothetical protein [Salmonella enterica]EAQ6819775.1 hypothetical protein [Salmonella enterica]